MNYNLLGWAVKFWGRRGRAGLKFMIGYGSVIFGLQAAPHMLGRLAPFLFCEHQGLG